VRSAIEDFVRQGGDFEQTALALYRWQRDNNPEYDRFCGAADPKTWAEIPAVPAALFRDLHLTSFEVQRAQVVFHTSGTTAGRPGRVHLLDSELYDLNARLHAERCLGPLPDQGISLVSAAPTSSLGHMCEHLVPGMPHFFSGEAGVDAAGAWDGLRSMAGTGLPLFLPGTAFALADLMDHPAPPVSLPEGSIVMITGGFKGRREEVGAAALHLDLRERLPGGRVVGEYGMSELASQLWASPSGSRFVPPPWMRVLAVDPWTGEAQTSGILRFFDLANLHTVLAIETADVGTVHPDGSLSLQGRLPSARPRGCSLSVEEARGR
jgi:hypothetical protein